MITDNNVLKELEDVLEEKVQDITGSIYGVLAEYRMHEKEPYIGVMVENELDDLKDFIIDFLTQHLKN